MTTSAQSLLESALARSTANDAGKLAVDGELLPFLNREYQMLWAVLSSKLGDNMTAKTTLTWASSPPTVALPTDIVDIVRIETAVGGRTYLIPISEKDRTTHLAPAYFRVGNSLFSRAGVGDPAAGDVYTLYHKDAPATISALATTLDARFPVRYEGVLVLKLAIYLETKDENRSPERITALKAELNDYLVAVGLVAANANTARESSHPAKNAPNSQN